MKTLLTAAIAAAALVAGSALAQETAPAPEAPAEAPGAEAGSDLDKVICRTARPPTGTRVAKARSREKVCRTKRDWEQEAAEAREILKLRDSGICSPGECRD